MLFPIDFPKNKLITISSQVVKEFMDIPRVLVTETMEEGVGLVSGEEVVVECFEQSKLYLSD